MDTPLSRLARLFGIADGYNDVWGHWIATPEATQRALLAAMGVDAASPDAALAAMDREAWYRAVPAITVLRTRELGRGVRIQLTEATLGRSLAWRIVEESGETREQAFTPLKLPLVEEHTVNGRGFRAFMLHLPTDLAEGYHRLAILEGGSLLGHGTIAVVPERCYLPPTLEAGGRIWGTTVQLYGLRSHRRDGLGNFSDLRACSEAWGERGAGIVGTNPLHALSLREPGHASPYSPSSRLFLNPLYIDIEAMADFVEIARHDRKLAEQWHERMAPLARANEVDYDGVAAAKCEMFERLYEHFRRQHLAAATPRARAFLQFRDARGPALRSHALHDALEMHFGTTWRNWPAEFQVAHGESAARFLEANPAKVGLHEYLQWQADLQLAAAQARCNELGMAVGLYADLAISIGPDGSEAWANQRLYALGVSVGAPPDEFNRQGQDWGLPPLSPRRLRDAAYAPLVATLRANMLRAGALRIDHVMGLARLWWVPAGCTADQGAYVHYPVDDLLGIVALESHRHRCLVIGEDLGTVPEELRVKLAEAEVLSYRLVLFEREGMAFKAPSSYPRRALVAWSTHDLPTLAGWWAEEDIRTRGAIGHYDTAMQLQQHEERAASRQSLLHALGVESLGPPGLGPDSAFTEALADSVHAFAARSPAAVMVVQMEDVLGIVEQANLPGTVEQHPNWRRRLPLTIEEWAQDPRLRRLTQDLAAQRGGRKTRREVPAGLEGARIPRATYRLQLHGEFTFRDATRIVPYLARLGVSDLYCSPFLRARPGSKHGYDIIDHDAINPEIGTRAELDDLVAALKAHGMAMLMDIVPNHMGVLAADNAWWQDVLENGPASSLADFFDIDWHPPSEHLANRVLLPVLGDHYGIELAAGRLALAFEPASGSFAVSYFTHRLPIDPREYPRILAAAVRELEDAGPDAEHAAQGLRALMDIFGRLPPRHDRNRAHLDERNVAKEVAKGRLALLARAQPTVGPAIQRAVEAINGRTDDPESFDTLHDLLERQPFQLAYWRVAQDEINYRRFFDINDLAALRQEHPPVFDATHRLILELVKNGSVAGLRIDHPDGLYDPREYFRRLQEACGKPTYVLVEKITAPFENLPGDWAVHGTTGYRFANVVNGLFVDAAAEARLTRTYTAFVGDETPFHTIARNAKRTILRNALASELTVLTSRLMKIARADRTTRDFTFTTLREGLTEVIAAFPVYRTYIDEHVRTDDRKYIEWAVTLARNESRAADVSVFDFLRDVLTCELPARSPRIAAAIRHFTRKVQQLTSPVMAKGVEDTSFYVYNRLLSLNDVGGDPDEFGFPPARFHRASSHRARYWRHTMLATSTHDNKRSEDVRARIDVISELVPEWRLQLRKWHRMNLERKTEVDGQPAPSRNDEYLLYQILLGSYPVTDVTPSKDGAQGVVTPSKDGAQGFTERIVAYMQKATREAKQRTSWANVNAPYEQATEAFVRALLEERPGNAFLEDLREAVKPVTWIGFLNSLSMMAVKLTSPGVPDTYQGNELWDFSLVDPDNRRPVDYAQREAVLSGLEASAANPEALLPDLLAHVHDGRAKLYVIWRLLQLRREREDLFTQGTYTAVRTSGDRGKHLVAFARRHDGDVCITVAPRLVAGMGIRTGGLPCGPAAWGATRIELPFVKDGTVLLDVLGGARHVVTKAGLDAGAILEQFPTAVLVFPREQE